jgi:hypothetical protein
MDVILIRVGQYNLLLLELQGGELLGNPRKKIHDDEHHD